MAFADKVTFENKIVTMDTGNGTFIFNINDVLLIKRKNERDSAFIFFKCNDAIIIIKGKEHIDTFEKKFKEINL